MAAPRFALCLLPEHIAHCGELARAAEKAGFCHATIWPTAPARPGVG
jgi:hypothetical protein